MTKFFFFIAISSMIIFSSCSKQEIEPTTIEITNEVDLTLQEGQVEFSIDNDYGQVYEEDALLLTNNSKNAVSYLWDFGNGDTSTEANPEYAYDHHGVFDVKLVITDKFGYQKETSNQILVVCLFDGQDHSSN